MGRNSAHPCARLPRRSTRRDTERRARHPSPGHTLRLSHTAAARAEAGKEERRTPAPRAGLPHTHQSSSRATFFSNINAKARAPTRPMLFPTRLEAPRNRACQSGDLRGSEATRAGRVAASRPLPRRHRQLTGVLCSLGPEAVSQQGVPTGCPGQRYECC